MTGRHKTRHDDPLCGVPRYTGQRDGPVWPLSRQVIPNEKENIYFLFSYFCHCVIIEVTLTHKAYNN